MKLTFKLTLAFLLISLIAIGLAAVFIRGLISYEFNLYLQNQHQNEFAVAATNYYQNNNSWSGVDTYLRTQGLLPPLTAVNPPLQPYILADANRNVLVASTRLMLSAISLEKAISTKASPFKSMGK